MINSIVYKLALRCFHYLNRHVILSDSGIPVLIVIALKDSLYKYKVSQILDILKSNIFQVKVLQMNQVDPRDLP